MDAKKVLKQWIIVNLFLLMCGCNSVLPANTPTAIPMEIATRIPTPVPPTATPTPPATSTITPTASPTLTVAPTPNIISAVLRDDFNDGAYDGSFNSNLWDQVLSSRDATCLITQKDGKLIFSQTAELKESRCALGTWKSANWLMTDLQQIKMQYWFESIEGEGDV
ncbi:MAG: hypothetical protein MUO64_16325, partial [Anaerolineales bacterium]|nr:hypothetical protein [Anaerolineales bacterium]